MPVRMPRTATRISLALAQTITLDSFNDEKLFIIKVPEIWQIWKSGAAKVYIT